MARILTFAGPSGQGFWWDGITRSSLESGSLDQSVSRGASGFLTGLPDMAGALRESHDYDREMEGYLEGGPDSLYDQLLASDVRRAADLLRPVFKASLGQGGYVGIDTSPVLSSVLSLVEEGRRLVRTLERRNVLVKLPPTPEGLGAIPGLVGAGVGVLLMDVPSPVELSAALRSYGDALSSRKNRQDRVDVPFFATVALGLSEEGLQADLGGKAAQILAHFPLSWQAAFESVVLEFTATAEWVSLVGKGAMGPRMLYEGEESSRPPGAVQEDLLSRLRELGALPEKVAGDLADRRLRQRQEAYRMILATIATHQGRLGGIQPGPILRTARETEDVLTGRSAMGRLLGKDPSLFGDDPQLQDKVKNRLGWVDLALTMRGHLPELSAFATRARQDGFTHALLLGMGGSSLAPIVFRQTFKTGEGGLQLEVLDSSSPDAVRRVTRSLPLERTLVIVSSKSGTTAEPDLLARHFQEVIEERLGRLWPRAFVAITDPGTPLDLLSRQKGYRKTFLNPPDIGGRYSALSFFGLVPLTLMGQDPLPLLQSAQELLGEGARSALSLGSLLGAAYAKGKDKITFLADPALASFPLWMEQLMAESTGKEGKGLLPVAAEPERASYRQDRIFVAFAQGATPTLRPLAEGGHPVLRYQVDRPEDLGREMLRFELAVALTGVVMGINPFDEPNVSESKANTARLLKSFEATGRLPVEGLMTAEKAGPPLKGLLESVPEGGYLQVAAYLDSGAGYDAQLLELRARLGQRVEAPVTSGYGPRFLHSVGQYHKGGRPVGAFLQLVADSEELRVPGLPYGFQTLIRAQAEGDREALLKRNFPVVTIDLGKNPREGLDTLLGHLRAGDKEATA